MFAVKKEKADGKRKNLAAKKKVTVKEKSSQQQKIPYGKRKP